MNMEHEMRYRLVSLLLVIFFTTSIHSQSCLPEGISFETQEQIDSFQINYPGCTEIEGDLIIPYPNGISSLHSLNSITAIGGELLISDCEELLSLDGLNNLQSIGGAFSLISNNSLVSLSALQNLTSIGGGLTISWNYSIKSLAGIDNIDAETIEAIHMIYNDSLSWCAVESVCHYLEISNNAASIQNAPGCESIEVVEEYCQQNAESDWAPLGSIWHYSQRTVDPHFISFTTLESVADTVIEGRVCKKIIEVRRIHDTVAVEAHYMYSQNDSVFSYEYGVFRLLYDFGASQGDTIILGYNGYDGPLKWIVDSTELIEINGEQRKMMHITCGDGISAEFGGRVIDGIGNLHFMFPRLDNSPYIGLRCYADDEVGLFLNPFHPSWGWGFEDCEELLTSIPESSHTRNIITYPNPFTTSTTIEFTLEARSKIQLSIYNSIGELVFEESYQGLAPGKHTITPSLHYLPAGMYYGMLTTEDGVGVVKIIKR